MPDPSAATIIYNPVAGRLVRRPDLIPQAAERLQALLGRLVLQPTTGPDTAGRLAREAIAAGSRLIIAAGGDGTVNEVVNGMAGSEVPLAVLPAGTANVLATETGIGSDLLRAADRYSGLEPRDIALGRLSLPGSPPRFLLLMAGVGLDARIVRLVDPAFKRRWGKLSYWQGGFAQVGTALPEFDVTFDGITRRASFALLSRVKNYGGDLEIARHADLLGDDFAVVLFEGPSSLRYLKYFAGVLVNRLDGMKGVTVARARSMEFRPAGDEPIDIQIDGEHAGFAPARLEIAPERLRLMLPRAFRSR
ncbi:MAG: NAD(+)/NADH kinase [Candidatus Solibacter usitatus]|nr:NAD(+)/NADH kinase [Candidatus Solibacter usitatus]